MGYNPWGHKESDMTELYSSLKSAMVRVLTPWKLANTTSQAVLVVVSSGDLFVLHLLAHGYFAAESLL